MLSCKEVCYIVSESLDGKLPWHKRLRVRIHLSMCKACRLMVRQMELLRAAASRYGSTEEKALPPQRGTLSEEASTRILTRLQQARDDAAGHE